MSRTVCLLAGVGILLFCCGLSWADDDEDDDRVLTGPNVCTSQVWSTEYITRNESYPCYVKEWRPYSECSGRKRNRDGCYVYVYGECWYTETYCETTLKDVYHCCDGYEEDGRGGCHKSIMCEDNNGGCEQGCVTDGSNMKCVCYEGFVMDTRQTCMDIDECLHKNGGCDQGCHNTIGSYYCSCRNGYRLTDHHTCTEIDECKMGNGMCEHFCHNVPGAHYCTCDEGFVLTEGFRCDDRDECQEPRFKHDCELCVNDYGGFHCECPEGKLLHSDNKTCIEPKRPDEDDDDTLPYDPTNFVTERLVAVEIEKPCPNTVGAIVGGVLGGIVLILLILTLLFFLYRRGCCDSILAPATKKQVPSAPPIENEYDALGELRKSKLPAFDNQAYGTGGHVIGMSKGQSQGIYDNHKPAKEGIYDNPSTPTAGPSSGGNFDDNVYDNV